METKDIGLPLAYSSHHQIVNANRDLAIQVCSGGLGVEGAEQLQDLVVVACNSYSTLTGLVAALVPAVEQAQEIVLQAKWPGADQAAAIQRLLDLLCKPEVNDALLRAGGVGLVRGAAPEGRQP